MSFTNEKLFFNEDYCVDSFELDHSNYYKSVRSKIDNGYKSIIISSDLMIDILKTFFKKKKATIVKIELLEEDPNYQKQLDSIVSSLKDNRDYFVDLVEELSFLSEDNNIEIKRIRFKFRENTELIDISISLNGLIDYSDNEFTKKELLILKNIISKYLKWLHKYNE